MDLMTIAGLIIGAFSVYVVLLEGKIVDLIYNQMAFILVFGGTVASTLISYPPNIIKKIPKLILFVFFPPKISKAQYIIEETIRLAKKAKTQGIESLAEERINDHFLGVGLQMILDNLPTDEIRDSLRKEIAFSEERHRQFAGVFRTMGTVAPVFGLLGTLVGVIEVMRNLSNPENIGAAMAIAIVTTFYGIFAANFLFVPMVNKLRVYSEEEKLAKEIAIEGLLSIQKKDIPYLIERKLELFLSKNLRKIK